MPQVPPEAAQFFVELGFTNAHRLALTGDLGGSHYCQHATQSALRVEVSDRVNDYGAKCVVLVCDNDKLVPRYVVRFERPRWRESAVLWFQRACLRLAEWNAKREEAEHARQRKLADEDELLRGYGIEPWAAREYAHVSSWDNDDGTLRLSYSPKSYAALRCAGSEAGTHEAWHKLARLLRVLVDDGWLKKPTSAYGS